MTDPMIDVLAVALRDHSLIASMIVGGSLIAALGLLLRAVSFASSAAHRHLILAATMLALLALPLVPLTSVRFELEILEPAPVSDVRQPGLVDTGIASDQIAIAPGSARPLEMTGPPATGSVDWPVLLYIAGIGFVLIPLVIGTIRMIWIVRTARPVDDPVLLEETAGRADLMTSPVAHVPMIWGWRRARVLLPEAALGWPDEVKRDALVHELAHLERRDLWIQTIARIAVSVHWFNPLAWMVLRRLLLEAEQACDDRVLQAGTGTADYADRLLRIAADARQASLRRLPAVAMARSSQLSTRIESLLERTRNRSSRIGLLRGGSILILLLVPALVLGAIRVEERAARDSDLRIESLPWDDDGSADDSPLYAAIRKGRVGVVERLLDAGADPNARWYGDGTPLMIAVRRGSDEIVDLLLARGARPDVGVTGDGNALIVAAARGDVRNLERFIRTGADIDAGVEGDGNPLIAAAGAGELEAVRLLVESGADLEVVVPGDENALITAAGAGRLEVLRYLVAAGADVNSVVEVQSWKHGGIERRSPLSRARDAGHDHVVRYLQSVGARN